MSLQAALEAGVAAGHAPGFVAAARTPDGCRVVASAGKRGLDQTAPMDVDTLFWIASCTKAVTSAAALQLVERGLIDLDEPLGARLPVLAAPRVLTGFDAQGRPVTSLAGRPVTLRHLLTHTSGFAYDFCSADLAQYLAATDGSLTGGGEADIPLLFEPGERWQYGIGVDWAGKVIEAVGGMPLDAWFAEHIFAPLGMRDTTFFPSAAQRARGASMHQKSPDGAMAPIAFAMPATAHFMMGGGGLYSTVGDYLTFLEAILNGGGGILRPETVAMMTANQVGDLQAGVLRTARPMLSHDFEPMPGVAKRWSLGFLVNQSASPGGRSAGALAWGGLANCYYWADPAAGVAGVLFAQVLPFADPGILATFEAVERAVYA